jgi:hypothetical protein
MAKFMKITRSGKLYLPGKPNNAIKYKQVIECEVADLAQRVGEFSFVDGTDKERKQFDTAKKMFDGYYDLDGEMFQIDRSLEDTESVTYVQTEDAVSQDQDVTITTTSGDPNFKLESTGKGWYNIINVQTGVKYNEKTLRKKDAEELIKSLG